MIATHEGGRSRPDHPLLWSESVAAENAARARGRCPVSRCNQKDLRRPEDARSMRAWLLREAETEGANTLPGCCLPFWPPPR